MCVVGYRGIVLTSTGFWGEKALDIAQCVSRFLGRDSLNEVVVGVINNASDVWPYSTSEEDALAIDFLLSQGAKIVEIDLRNDPSQVRTRLEAIEVLYVEGGNTPYLMDLIEKSGINSYLHELLQRVVYVGASAGAIVVTPSIWTAFLCGDVPMRFRLKGLGVVNFYVWPHYSSWWVIILKLLERLCGKPIYPLRNDEFWGG